MRLMPLCGDEKFDGLNRHGCASNNRLAGQVRSGVVRQRVGVLKLVATLSIAIVGSCIALADLAGSNPVLNPEANVR
jgi:hypothetical protein